MNAESNLDKPGIMRTQIGVMTYIAPSDSLLSDAGLRELQDCAALCMLEHQVNLVLDFSKVEVVNSKLLNILLDIQDKLIRLGGALKIASACALLREVFRVTGVHESIPIMELNAEQRTLDDERPLPNLRLGERLTQKKIVSAERIAEAMELQKKTRRRLGHILIDKGWASEREVYQALAEQLRLPFAKLRRGLYDPTEVFELTKGTAERLQILPLFRVRGVLSIATADPQDMPSLAEVEERLGVKVAPVLALPEDIRRNLQEAYSYNELIEDLVADLDDNFEVVDNAQLQDYDAIDELAAGSPVINLVNSIIQRAVRDGASDIHIEPSKKTSRVRFRIDGVLYEVMTPSASVHPALVSRLKVMANLDIAERRLPQDGRIQVQTSGRQVDLRFSSLPGLYGEKVVLRVLDKNQAILNLHKLGMRADGVQEFKGLLQRSYGLILVTGPTGSGKTTSLYAALNHLNSMKRNIVTIEDPVEYQLDIINQNEVRAGIGLTFAKMLKHILRQDPDIVMVGEIRERETAEIAVQAALTGHLVLSTLHTNDSIGAITRMIDMGVEPYMLSSALLGVVAQRLLRTVCPTCKTKFVAPPDVVSRYGWDPADNVQLAKGRGCPDCYDSGYKGRVGIHEILQTNTELQQLVMTNPSRDQLNEYLVQNKIKTLFSHGLDRVAARETTLEELSRVVNL